ncbi:MAG: autotransporter outer membrane beta-barrel domain-containing protein, partial [Planctomycetaceae bacterium]|nr:autotransporter outer membrane beta-barrel domain-containing protein [Planctomycetaceae bacterium]
NIQAKSLKAAAFDGYSAAAVMHNRHTALNAVRDHLLMAVNYDGYQYRAQAPAYNVQPISAQNTSIPPIGSAVRAAWGNYIGRSTKYRSPAGGDWDIISDGFQAGTEIFRAADCQIGTFFGYEGQKAERTAATVDGEDFYFGFYGSHISCDGTDLRAVVNFGFQQFDINRSFNTINGGVDRYQSSVNGNSLELNFEAGKSGWWGPWKLRLAGAVDVYGNRLASAADNHNVRFGGSDYWQTFLRLGADFRYEWDRFVFNGKLYYMYDVCGDQIHADLSGGNLSGTLSAPVPGRSVVQFSAGGAYHLCDTLSLFGSFTGDCATDRGGAFQSTGQAGLAWKW